MTYCGVCTAGGCCTSDPVGSAAGCRLHLKDGVNNSVIKSDGCKVISIRYLLKLYIGYPGVNYFPLGDLDSYE